MENKQESDFEKSNIELPKLGKVIEEKINKTIKEPDIKKVFSDLKIDSNLTDKFFDSIKSFFDMGFELANSINLDFLLDLGKIVKKDKESKK